MAHGVDNAGVAEVLIVEDGHRIRVGQIRERLVPAQCANHCAGRELSGDGIQARREFLAGGSRSRVRERDDSN